MDVLQLRENRSTWETIADSFNSTRGRPWRPVLEFLETVPTGARLLDAGCGNGRHARAAQAKGLEVVGVDFSRKLLRHARREVGGAALVEAAVERIPFRDASFDAGIASAVLHHVRGREERIAVVRDLVRVLKPGGRLLLSVWSRDQPRFGPGKEPRPPTDGGAVEEGDAWVRWTQHGHDEPRFIHLFMWNEWRRELDYAHGRIERVWPEAIAAGAEPDNFFAILRK
ncbi:MAG TPA: class I SAM-dependent methyltransferase [Candidatus Thermoplasmatota archaeon]|nr:class I SAM-dependent methyltransferase [Candidatus Thermoplasmatota archaeon]